MKLRASFPGFEAFRHNNPLIATLTTTGGGKSRNLDEVGALHAEDLRALCADPQMREILLNSVAVSVTFNGATPILEGVDEVHPHLSIPLRVLYRYWTNIFLFIFIFLI